MYLRDKNFVQMDKFQQKSISAEDFVDRLLNDAGHVTCDRNATQFNEQSELPLYYNEQLYKMGQKFFYKNYFALFFGNLLGLLSLGGLPSVKLLKLTNKSSTPMTAYRRYAATILHMLTWYDDDFRSGSTSLSSIAKVRNMHNSASKLGGKKIDYPINQKDMALTQFGFMGFAIVRSEMIGIHDASNDELEGFIHLWRVIGYLLGVDEKYNICRESVQETKDICKLLIDRYIHPTLKNRPEEFELMARVVCEGFWAMNPIIQYDTYMCYTHMALEDATYDNMSDKNLKKINGVNMLRVKFIGYVVWMLRYSVVRIVFNCLQRISVWILRHFPIFAYYKFGVKNAHVRI